MTGAHAYGAELVSVATDEKRGEDIRSRRMLQGFSLRGFALKSGVSRDAITAAEEGRAREDTYQRLEAFLDYWEKHVGEDVPSRKIQLTVEGEGLTVTAASPVGDPDVLAAYVAALFRQMRENRQSPDPPETDL